MICCFRRHRLRVFIPSTIGAFGPSTPRDSTPDCTVQEPTTIYGVSKIYAERLGEYYHSKFGVDFRCLRFPGIISATKPGGGTTGQSTANLSFRRTTHLPLLSDYAIKIFYDALQHGKHVCYLRPDTRLPMMYDTDCMSSVVQVCVLPPPCK
jgi:threonine 3-dehydrogenase